jgi:hypothetical protein
VGLLRHGERFWLLIVCKKGSGPWVVVLLLVSLVSSMFSDGISISCGLSEVSVCHVEASVALATRLGVFCVLPTRNVDNDLCIVDMNWRCLSSWSFRSFFVRESWAGSSHSRHRLCTWSECTGYSSSCICAHSKYAPCNSLSEDFMSDDAAREWESVTWMIQLLICSPGASAPPNLPSPTSLTSLAQTIESHRA